MLDQLDEFFLGTDHPFLLTSEAVSKLTTEERRNIMYQLQDSWGQKFFYVGLGSSLLLSILYIRKEVGYFPSDLGSVVGFGLLTSATSLLGGAISGCVGTILAIGRGMWRGLISPNDFQFGYLGTIPDFSSNNYSTNSYSSYQSTGNNKDWYQTSNDYKNSIAYARHQEFLASRPWHPW